MHRDNFNPGDIVRLKSGGPNMTLERININYKDRLMWVCVWFDGTQNKTADFLQEALELRKANNSSS